MKEKMYFFVIHKFDFGSKLDKKFNDPNILKIFF